MTPFYFDVHVPAAIADQLRRRGVDILNAQEDGTAELEDPDLLTRRTALGRVLFTQDIRFKARAEDWQRQARSFAGLIFGHQLHGSIGQYVRDLELISKATEPEEWIGRIATEPHGYIPTRRSRPHRGARILAECGLWMIELRPPGIWNSCASADRFSVSESGD